MRAASRLSVEVGPMCRFHGWNENPDGASCGASTLQRSCYSGHKRFHRLVYQTITTPDGLILHLYGSMEGRQPDAYLYRQSGIDEDLRHHYVVNGKQYYLYAEKAYVLRPWMQTAYPHLPMKLAHT
eukprot:IDg1540t1